ncbi:hypothetical protein LCGC14_0423060 [marine sediment metagenome]|uniref:Uncharacterized protein n=1 Tax=marine sediment metagenome TaxID=412755 RepID=A0A0F9VZQ1_9ZZZZ
MKQKLYKVNYARTSSDDPIYFSASKLSDVIDRINPDKEIRSINLLGKIEHITNS